MIIDGLKTLSSVERIQYEDFLRELESPVPSVVKNGVTFTGAWTAEEIDEVMRDIERDHAKRLNDLCQQLPNTELTTESEGSVFKGLMYAVIGMVAMAVGIWLGRR